MLVPFDQMSDSARIWIYQAERKLNQDEVSFVKNAAKHFLTQWKAHGQDLKSSFSMEYDQFLILTVDESHNQASGCSIDASVHLIQNIEQELDISFSTNGKVAFVLENEVVLKPFNTIKDAIQNQEIQMDTAVFDNTIQSLAAFRSKWPSPSRDTWIGRYF